MTDILMPKLSDTMEEGKIIRWLKQRGDKIAIGDVLAEVETDKADMELEAFDEGVLAEIKTGEGETAPVGAVIAVLGEGDGAATEGKQERAADEAEPRTAAATDTATTPDDDEAETSEEEPARRASAAATEDPTPTEGAEKSGDSGKSAEAPRAQSRTAASKAEHGASRAKDGSADTAQGAATAPRPVREAPGSEAPRVRASPLARRRAGEAGVNLETVRGTGPGGRIVERDVEAASREATPRDRQGATAARPAPAAKPAAREGRSADAAVTRVEPSKLRRTTARRMAEAKRDIPHFYASTDVEMDECVRLKDGLAALEGEYTGITYTHLVLKAVGLALRRVPEMNASLDGETVVLHQTAHVGLATATDDGLMVPVVRDCDRQLLGALVAQVRGLVERTRAGKFAPDDLRGGTFTVSNLGMYPVSHFAAVVNPPQAAILAVGAARAVPVVRHGAVVPGHVMTLTLSCDHRVVDGALAGRFLAALNGLLGAPLVLVA